jgi:hypothetical protein
MDPTRQRSRGDRHTSPGIVDSDNGDGDWYVRMRESFIAEAERISRLSMEERMAEDGREILRRLKREPTTTILLQVCHRTWAVCDARKCPIVLGDNYRVVLGTRHRKCFHVSYPAWKPCSIWRLHLRLD